ncbi:MAG: uridine diphosphate-N-acetylglucosamine-binding protein YvcK [Actinomycetota bacterium]|nr:uridine diphosphate-N-acetylglucosamine-binding protein YvcK [Actinomycetota bacterium]
MKVVGLGGGHGLASTLRAARLYAAEVSAVVTVADDGGSSGRLTRELGIPPPGDIRNCLVALADDSDLARVYQHRFESGALTGHPAGNLLIAALTELTGDFGAAVDAAGRLVGARGKVYPATTALVELRARVEGGIVEGQVNVATTETPIRDVYLSPSNPPAYGPAVDAILAADQILLGPGSLFTSLIATLLVPGIRDALQRSGAHRVFLCNSRMQKGETEQLDAAAHLEALLAHAGPGTVDTMVIQDPPLPVDGVAADRDALSRCGVRVVDADVADETGAHDPARLASCLVGLR